MSKVEKKSMEDKVGGVLMVLELLLEKLQRGLSFPQWGTPDLKDAGVVAEAEVATTTMVPDDVKEGHFAVFAVKGEEQTRFIVELGYLTNPSFLFLLEKAKEEYGYGQKGALSVPCQPQDLQKILEQNANPEKNL